MGEWRKDRLTLKRNKWNNEREEMVMLKWVRERKNKTNINIYLKKGKLEKDKFTFIEKKKIS